MSSIAYVMLWAQETRVVINKKLAHPSQQCFCTFLTLGSDFFAESQTPVVHQAPYSPDIAPMQLLAASQTQEDI